MAARPTTVPGPGGMGVSLDFQLGWIETVTGHEAVDATFKSKDRGPVRATEPRRIDRDALQHRLQLELGPADDAENFRRRRQLVQRLAQFAGKPSDVCLPTRSGRGGRCCSLRRIAAFQLLRLSTSPLHRSAACFGAPLHRVLRRLRGIVAGRRPALEVAYSGSSNEPLRRQLLKQRLCLLQVARVEPFGEPAVHRSEQFASLLRLALVAPEACEAHGGAEFPGRSLLLAGH